MDTDKPRHAGGRPLIQLEDLPENWEALIINEMRVGASLAEIYGLLDISEPTFKRLCRDHPEFSRTIRRGKRLSERWWLEIGRIYLRDKDFSATLWYMNMKNRFGWRDRTDITSNSESINFTNGVPRPKE